MTDLSLISPATITALKADIARQSFRHFIEYVQPGFVFNWHHLVIIDALQRLAERKFWRLIIMMPPRHGKSEMVSRIFPAWCFARSINEQIIVASYAVSLASAMGRDCQRIIDSETFRTLFPETRLSEGRMDKASIRTNEHFDIVGGKGYYIAAGVGGGITGVGATVAITDDLIKNAQQADSETYRNATWEWKTTTFDTRFEPGCIEVACVTRWHEDDYIARMLENDAPGTEVVSFPALAEVEDENRKIGEALWPGKYDRAALLAIQSKIGSRAWNSLFQQRPAPVEGNEIKRAWFNYYDPRKFDYSKKAVCFYFDTAYTENEKNDPTAGIAYVKQGADFYVLECTAEHLEFLEAMQFIVSFATRNGHSSRSVARVEPKASGKSLVQVAKKQTGLNIIEGKPPKGDKVSRVRSCAGVLEGGRVYLPAGMAWVGSFLDECAAFPNGAHDDQVDCLTGMILSEGKGFSIHYG